MVRRICEEDLNGDWYVHWEADGSKTWQLIQWNISDQHYHLYHRDGSIQRIHLVQQGGIPGAFVNNSGRQSSSGELEAESEIELQTGESSNNCLDSDIETQKSQSSLSPRPRRPRRSHRVSSPSIPAGTFREKRLAARSGDNQLGLPASNRVHAELPQILPDPCDNTINRQSPYTQKVRTKTTPRLVSVIPCILDDQFVWGEWPHGKFSNLDVHGLFIRVANCYGIENDSSFEEVEFHFIDLVPEKSYFIRRSNVPDFEQMMARIKDEVIARPKYQASFWIGMRPVIETANGELDVDL